MLRYILRRLLLLIPSLLAASAIIFLLLRLSTGDPVLDYLRLSDLPPTEKMATSIRELLGLDQPLAMRYLHWLWWALHLDFGLSYAIQHPVLSDLLHLLPATPLLTGTVLVLIPVTSPSLGIWVVRHRDRLPDYVVRLIASLGVSMPNFWLTFLLVMLFSVYPQRLSAMGYGDWQHLTLPAVSIAFMSLAINARLLRASTLGAANQRHVIWARLRGLSARQVECRHILRNATLPVVTAPGIRIGELTGGTMIIEDVFARLRAGCYTASAILNRDYPVIQYFILMMMAVFMLANLTVDVPDMALNPRLCRHEEVSA